MDGLIYAVISRNLAEGVGSLWRPILTPTLTPVLFSDQPPLVFWIESQFYRVFSDHILIENLYSCFTAVMTGLLMLGLWREATRSDPELKRAGWLPILFWTMIPQVTWSYSNNMLENTLSIFTTATCLVLVATFVRGTRVVGVGVASVMIVAGILSKGPLALFPAATILIVWFVFRRMSLRAAMLYTLLLMGLVAAMMGALLLWNEAARENIFSYFRYQFVASIEGRRGAAPNRLDIVFKVLQETAPVLAVCGILLFLNRVKRWAVVMGTPVFRMALVCLLLGVSGSLPIVFSARQNGYYLVPSFSMYALGAALLVVPIVDVLVSKIRPGGKAARVFFAVSCLALVSVVGYSVMQVGTVRREKSTIGDVKAIGAVVPAGSTVTVCSDLWDEWTLHGYLSRYYHINLGKSGPFREFAVIGKNGCESVDMKLYERVPVETQRFDLYRAQAGRSRGE